MEGASRHATLRFYARRRFTHKASLRQPCHDKTKCNGAAPFEGHHPQNLMPRATTRHMKPVHASSARRCCCRAARNARQQ